MPKLQLVRAHYQDDSAPLHFTEDGWFNATEAAARYGKRPIDWLKQKENQEYLTRLGEFHKVTQDHFVKTRRGTKSPGTWFSPRLAVPFARWLDLRSGIFPLRREIPA